VNPAPATGALDDAARAAIAAAATVLREGGVVCFPTESFYGLAALARDPAALAREVAAKQRPPVAPIACVAHDWDAACLLWRRPPLVAHHLAARHWPGPLTLVCEAAAGLSATLCGPAGVGVRVPSHAWAMALAAAVGEPITATSANVSGAPPPCTTLDARVQLGGAVDIYLDGGTTMGGAPSTVVELPASGHGRVVRPGAITLSHEELSWPK
jgi:L-threonylcarbamoyladenylate synthase